MHNRLLSFDPLAAYKIESFDTIDSTFSYFERKIRAGEELPDLVIAAEQTAGRGREGKSFYSPKNTGLYFTFRQPSGEDGFTTVRIALSVQRAIYDVLRLNLGLKWVNDLYLDTKKVCGILCKKVGQYELIGIGINVEEPSFIPPEISRIFGSLTVQCEKDRYAEIIAQILAHYEEIKLWHRSELVQQYRSLCFHIGKRVALENNGAIIEGECLDIADDFSLIIKSGSTIRTYNSGVLTVL